VEYIEVGYSSKSFGVRGELKCLFEEHYMEDVTKASALFFYINGQYIPFFQEAIVFDKFFRLKLEDINSKEDTVPLHNKTIYLRKRDVKTVIEENKENEWIGYKVFDLNSNQEIGLIEEIHELPEQLIAEIRWHRKAIYIPMHPDLIEEFNPDNKTIKMKLAEGLLDL
jgi:16S rRNA processing protein RimM